MKRTLLSIAAAAAITTSALAQTNGVVRHELPGEHLQTKLVPVTQTGFLRPQRLWTSSDAADHHKAVVRVWSPTTNFGGSGAIIKTDTGAVFAVTNHHVIEGSQAVTITGAANRPVNANVVYSNRQQDLAVLYAPSATSKYALSISSVTPPVGVTLEMCGFGGPTNTLRHFVGRMVRHTFGYPVSINAYTVSGDSGGPILWNGALVGVNFGHPGRPSQYIQDQGGPWGAGGPASSNVGPSELAATLNQVCTPYGCRPVLVDPRTTRPPAVTTPPPAAVAQPGPAGPPGQDGKDGVQGPRGPAGPPGKDAEVTAEQLAAIAAAITKQLKADPSLKGELGEKGDAGRDAVVDYDVLASEVMRRLPPIYMRQQVMDPATKQPIGEPVVDEIHLGEGFTFYKYPGVVNDAGSP